MKELKIRVWLKDKSYNPANIDDGKIYDLINSYDTGIVGDCILGFFNKGTYDIELFTGLHDKNGREIYEGDIINGVYPGNPVKQVYWSDVTHGFKTDGHNELDYSRDIYVIGNIHENPELLEAKR